MSRQRAWARNRRIHPCGYRKEGDAGESLRDALYARTGKTQCGGKRRVSCLLLFSDAMRSASCPFAVGPTGILKRGGGIAHRIPKKTSKIVRSDDMQAPLFHVN